MKHLMKIRWVFTLLLMCCSIFNQAEAKAYPLPASNDAIIGDMSGIDPAAGSTLLSVAQTYNLGLNSIEEANPGYGPVNPLPPGLHLIVPTEHILPPVARRGIVINLSEMRLYYYPAGRPGEVLTYPVGIGRVGKTIPLAHTEVVRKKEHPVWIPPADIIAFDKEELGIVLPKVMGPGPDNPLGPYAIYIKIPTYLIHSTIFPDSIGRRASFGCIRMLEQDIKEFFPYVTPGTSVTIIDMPNKIGWQGNALYLESHQPLEERSNDINASMDGVIAAINNASNQNDVFVDWQLAAYLAETHDGIPHEIGFRVP